MMISEDRISADIDAIAALTQTSGAGCTRPTFTPQWTAARDYVIEQATRSGCAHRIDAAGNVHIRPASLSWELPVWLSGSHVDTVPNGGKFDGVAGVVVPLEILRAADESGQIIPLELVIFAEEEGTTFGLGMLGSRAWCGTVSPQTLASALNGNGDSYASAGASCGCAPHRLAEDGLRRERYRGMIEVHVEQGPSMWERGIPVAVVTSVAGRRQYACTVRGVANHAGSTPMKYRRDALAGAAELISGIERIPSEIGERAVATVGKIEARPGAINVIPDEAHFTIDLRAPEDGMIAWGADRLERLFDSVGRRRKLAHELRQIESLPAIAFDACLCQRLRAAAVVCGAGDIPDACSGALHDAAIVAPFLPTAMLFVASRDGISHNPDEFSRVEDIALAARIVAEAVRS